MAKLHRFLKLNDRFDSQVFTFALPHKLATDFTPDTYTKDIIYGQHKWSVYFIRTDVHVGCFLKLQTVCDGMKCQIDFSFTLLNKEHFTRNESFIEKGCMFTTEANQHGRKSFIGVNDLLDRDFKQETGEFLIELEMRKVVCTIECAIRLPKENPNSRYAYETKLESPYFSYGLFDWSISLFPSDGGLDQEESVALQLHRHTSFDHICNVRYFLTLGENGAFQSEELDQLVDVAGNGDIYTVNTPLYHLARGRSTLKMKITMVTVVSVSEVSLNIASRSKSRAHFYDRDKQAWLMEADTSGKYLGFRLYYTDVTHVPRKYSRFVCWNIVVLTRYIPDKPVKTNFGPYSRYYVQQDLDEGYFFETTIPVNQRGEDMLHKSFPEYQACLAKMLILVSKVPHLLQLQDASCLYTEPDDPRLTVHIEWVDSHLLATPTYHVYDDIDKMQKHQMKREILALQSENLVLEKQLHSYQMSLAKSASSDKEKDAHIPQTPHAYEKLPGEKIQPTQSTYQQPQNKHSTSLMEKERERERRSLSEEAPERRHHEKSARRSSESSDRGRRPHDRMDRTKDRKNERAYRY